MNKDKTIKKMKMVIEIKKLNEFLSDMKEDFLNIEDTEAINFINSTRQQLRNILKSEYIQNTEDEFSLLE